MLNVSCQDTFEKALEHAQLRKCGVRSRPGSPLVRDEPDSTLPVFLVHARVVVHQQPPRFQHLVGWDLTAKVREFQVEKGLHGQHVHGKSFRGRGAHASSLGAGRGRCGRRGSILGCRRRHGWSRCVAVLFLCALCYTVQLVVL